MNFNQIWSRFLHLFISPKTEMENVHIETGRMGETYLYLFICCFFVGLSCIRKGFVNLFSETIIWFVTILIATLAVWLVIPKLKITATWAKSFKLVVLMITPFLVCVIIGNFIGVKPILFSIGALYSVFLLYLGAKLIFNTPNIKLILILILVVILIVAISNFIARVLIP